MNRLISVLGILTGLILALPAIGSDAEFVDIRDLTSAKHHLVGKRISTHGCLNMDVVHGDFIEPCGSSNWRELTVVDDMALYKTIIEALKSLKPGTNRDLEADFSGVIAEETSSWPEPGTPMIVLRLESISEIKRHEP